MMQLGMIGLGKMGANMVRRLMRRGHQCVVFDVNPEHVQRLTAEGAVGASSMDDLISRLSTPRAVWVMVPAGAATEATVELLAQRLNPEDIIIDGGNSYFKDDVRRAKALTARGIHYVDVGTSGGTWGLDRGYCLMIGGEAQTVEHLKPLFESLAPGSAAASPSPGREVSGGTAEQGYLHCGPAGAGHFVKMVHNGIEYGMMAAYAEGFNILKNANIGRRENAVDAETTPLSHPEHYQYEFDLGEIAELWRRGSVVSSWLLDLTAIALAKSPQLADFAGQVSDSGEGRWTLKAAIDEGAPAPVLSAALFQRFASRGEDEFTRKLVSAMRFEFGGHGEKR